MLTTRITLGGSKPDEPEDFLASALGTVFPDDVSNQHGDPDHPLVYASPHVWGPDPEATAAPATSSTSTPTAAAAAAAAAPSTHPTSSGATVPSSAPPPLRFELFDPNAEQERRLFSHYLWNSSLLLAQLIERDTLRLPCAGACSGECDGTEPTPGQGQNQGQGLFDVRGHSVVEVGAGTGLPTIMAALLGAGRCLVTDYPSEPVLEVLRRNVAGNTAHRAVDISVEGHEWGVFGAEGKAATQRYDRVVACDCLWMPWQHGNLRRSLGRLLADGPDARAWVVAGFHTGRANMAAFFDGEALAREAGLRVLDIWERDCDGEERAWRPDGEEEDPRMRKRWLAVAVLGRI